MIETWHYVAAVLVFGVGAFLLIREEHKGGADAASSSDQAGLGSTGQRRTERVRVPEAEARRDGSVLPLRSSGGGS